MTPSQSAASRPIVQWLDLDGTKLTELRYKDTDGVSQVEYLG